MVPFEPLASPRRRPAGLDRSAPEAQKRSMWPSHASVCALPFKVESVYRGPRLGLPVSVAKAMGAARAHRGALE